MNGTTAASMQKPTAVQLIAVVSSSLIGLTLAFAIMWCSINKIYIDAPMLMLIGTVLGGIGGALTTILVGRSLQQLNSPVDGETTMEQTTKTVTKPKEPPPPTPTEPVPVVITQPEGAPVPVEEVTKTK